MPKNWKFILLDTGVSIYYKILSIISKRAIASWSITVPAGNHLPQLRPVFGVFGAFSAFSPPPKSSRGSLPGASPSACPRPLVTAAGSSSRASAQSQSDTTGHRRQDDVSTRNPAVNCDCCGIEGPLQYRVSSDQCEGWIFVCPSCWPKIRLQEGYRYGGTRKADRRKRIR